MAYLEENGENRVSRASDFNNNTMNSHQLLAKHLGQAWDSAIRDFLVKKLGLSQSFEPRDHASFIAANGRFAIHYDGTRDFCWEGTPVLRGELIESERSTRYVITKLKPTN